MEFLREESSTVFVVMCGLPGAGKSTISKALQAACKVKYPHAGIVLVEYDELVKSIIPKEWKRQRQDVLEAVSCLIQSILTGKSDHEVVAASHFSDLAREILRQNAQELPSVSALNKIVVIIDDNMYYRSMRYEVFQRALQLRAGFCQIHISPPLEITIRQNLLRTCPVPSDVIARMAAVFEPPNATKYKFERFSLDFNAVTSASIDDARALIFRAMQNPPRNADSGEAKNIAEERMKAQEITRTNMLHQADRILRLLVQTKCSFAKSQGRDVKDVSSRAVGCRKKLLQQLRDMTTSDFEFEASFDVESFLSKEFGACFAI